MVIPGPPALGRSVVVGPGQVPPSPWAGAPRYRVDEAALADPAATVEALHRAWLDRRAVTVELVLDPAELRAPETEPREPYQLGPHFELARERLQFLVWANAYDARARAGPGGAGDPPPIWWHGRRALRLGATEGGPADVMLADGRPAWCDGGPSQTWSPAELIVPGAVVVHRWSLEAGSLAPVRAGPSGPAAGGGLAPDQWAAVTHARGPARVIAPAGSGKTRVLTARLRHLLVDRGVEPSSVTAVAFNRKAAEELVQRTADLGASGVRPQVRTIHSLALAICQGLGGGSPRPRVRVVEEREARRILETLTQVRPQANTDALAPYLEGLAAVRIGLVVPSEAEAASPDATGLEPVYRRYRDILAKQNLVDFDEQVYRAIEILLTDPEARRGAQARARHLLVDEVQDLAPAHLLLLRLVSAPVLDCFGVGDDDQVIYGYAGADPDYLIHFERDFPGARPYALEVNYRCPPEVVRGATHLLSYNRRRIPKAVRAAPRPPGPGGLVVTRVAAEGTGPEVVAQVRAWCQGGVPLGDIAVLARVNAALLGAQVALAAAGVPATAPLDARVLDRTGTRAALAYLRIAGQPERITRADLLATIRRPSRRIAANVVDMAAKGPSTSVAAIRRLARRLSGRDGPKLEAFASELGVLSRAVPAGSAAVLAAVRTTVGLGEAMEDLDGSKGALDRSAHGDDLAALEEVAALHPEVATFEAWLREILAPGGRRGSLGPEAPAGDRVELSSVHRVKGREWGHVVVLGARTGLFPHRLAPDLEEERRVFHVAITRGSRSVVVLADEQAPSPFVAELERPAPPAPAEPESQGALSAVGAGGWAGRAGGGGRGRDRPGGRAGAGDRRESRRGDARSGPAHGPEPGSGRPGWDEPLARALRDWRREQAGRDGVPAYVILSDEHLSGIARRRPTTVRELARCKGMGPVRLDRYADDILAVVEAATVGSERA